MKIIFSRDEVAKILTDYIETMIDVKVTDVSKYLDDMTFQCEKIDHSDPQDGTCATCGHAAPVIYKDPFAQKLDN